MHIIYKGAFHNGFARVQREDYLYNYIDKNGNLLSPNMWLKFASIFYDDNTAIVKRQDNMWNFMNTHGEVLSQNQWFRHVLPFKRNVAAVQRNDKMWNAIDKKGNILSPNMWFNFIVSCPSKLYKFGIDNSHIFFFTDNLKLHKFLIY